MIVNGNHTIKFISRDMPFTGLETRAEESEENNIKGRSNKRTMTKIMEKPHMIFSLIGRAWLLFFTVSFWAPKDYE